MADAVLSPEEFDLLAAELALGVIEGEDRVRALRLQLADRSFRTAVAAWQERLAPMLAEIPSAAPGTGVWPRIEQMLAPVASGGVLRKLRAWRAGAVAASAAAALFAVLLVTRPAPEPARPAEAAVAQLLDQSGAALLVARYDQASGTLRVRAVRLPESQRVPELWVVPAGGAPQSLGLINRTGVSNVAAEPAVRALLQDGAVIAVTLEPADGLPHQAPSGVILGSAPLSTL